MDESAPEEAPERAPQEAIDRAARAFERIPHARALGMRIDELVTGRGVMALPYDPRLIGNPRTGVVHGGVITALLDTLCGIVVMTVVPTGQTIATLDLRIDYLHPATPGAEIRASAECYKRTAAIAFVRGIAFHDDPADPIANATGSFIIGGAGFASASADGEFQGGQPC
jgi:uncharacterized protein (TIGR00369 family)